MRTIVTFAIAAILQSAALAEAPWWDAAYLARRQVTVYVPDLNLPGDDAAVITFYTGGRLRPDGSDLRVVARGKEVPYKLYGVGPGDTATVAFRVGRGLREYHVYFGNAAAAAPKYDWEPQRGLILETRGFNGGRPQNISKMWDIWRAASPFCGADGVERVWHGQNMFGPSESFASLYTGWFFCSIPGEYLFATSSDDASFLLVDDKLVVAWPDMHGPVADARHNGATNLQRGLHRLQYLHVNSGGTTCAVAAWRTPGAEGFEIIPPTAFAPLSRAVIGPVELAGGAVLADFSVEIQGEALLTKAEENYAVRAAFTASKPPSRTVYWDFGDGQTGSGLSVTHIYLAPDVYRVTMRAGKATDAPSVTNSVNIHRHWGWQTKKDIDDVREYFPEIALYNLATLDAASCENLLTFAAERGDTGFSKRIALALVSRSDAGAESLERAIRQLRISLGTPSLAGDEAVIAAYNKALAGAGGGRKAILAMAVSDILLEKGQAVDAQRLLETALSETLDGPMKRRLLIACAGAASYAGDRKTAENALFAADEIPLRRSGIQQMALGGAIAFKAEGHLAKKEYAEAENALDSWDWERPLEKLEGYSSYLRAKLYLGMGRESRVLRELDSIAAVSPESAYAPKALLLEGRIYSSKGDREAARAALGRIIERYQTSPEVREAAQMLRGLGGSKAQEVR